MSHIPIVMLIDSCCWTRAPSCGRNCVSAPVFFSNLNHEKPNNINLLVFRHLNLTNSLGHPNRQLFWTCALSQRHLAHVDTLTGLFLRQRDTGETQGEGNNASFGVDRTLPPGGRAGERVHFRAESIGVQRWRWCSAAGEMELEIGRPTRRDRDRYELHRTTAAARCEPKPIRW